MKKVQLTMVYHTLDAQRSHDMKESFGITAYLEAYEFFWWARSSNRSSVFVICHNSLPYNKIGRQKVLAI